MSKRLRYKQKQAVATLTAPRQNGRTVARFASYPAAHPDKTRQLANRIGTNPNSAYAQMERVTLMWQAEELVKSSDWNLLLYALKQYCQPTGYCAETGDAELDNEVNHYLREVMRRGGINCSAMQAFSTAAHVEMPVRGDSILEVYRDISQPRLVVQCADQIGELYRFVNPASYGYDAWRAPLTCEGYLAGVYHDRLGQYLGFKIYERGYNQTYLNPHDASASECIYFQDNMFAGMRGISKFAPAIQSIQKRNKTWQSGMDSMALQSKIAAIATNEQGEPDELTYQTVESDGTIQYVETMADGAIVKYQFKGDGYQFMKSEQPGQALLEGLDYADERTCLALGFPKSFLISARDGGGAPSRFDAERAGKEILRLRKEVYVPRLEKMAYIFIMDGVQRGALPARAGILRGTWHFPTLPTADAFRDGKADIEDIRAGITTRQSVIARNGEGTFEQVLKQSMKEAIAIEIATQEANKELVERGYKPTIQDMNIAQDSPNPNQQTAPGEQSTQPKAQMAEWDESKHSRDEDGKFGDGGGHGKASQDARSASDAAHADSFSPLKHKEAAKAHVEAIGHKKARIEAVKNSSQLGDGEKKKLISGYKKDIKFHEFMSSAHETAAKETDEFQKQAEKKE